MAARRNWKMDYIKYQTYNTPENAAKVAKRLRGEGKQVKIDVWASGVRVVYYKRKKAR